MKAWYQVFRRGTRWYHVLPPGHCWTCYHLLQRVTIWYTCYHLVPRVTIWYTCYHLVPRVTWWYRGLLSGTTCYLMVPHVTTDQTVFSKHDGIKLISFVALLTLGKRKKGGGIWDIAFCFWKSLHSLNPCTATMHNKIQFSDQREEKYYEVVIYIHTHWKHIYYLRMWKKHRWFYL